MFDLDQEIRNWRKTIEQRLPQRTDSVNELESHLRDAFQKHLDLSKPPEDAWRSALNDLGDADAIAAEFRKLPRRKLLHWMPVRIVMGIYGLVALFITWFVITAFFVRRDTVLVMHVWSITLGYFAILAFGLFTGWLIISRAFKGWTELENELYLRATCSATILALFLNAGGVYLGGIWIRNQSHQFLIFDFREIGGIAVLASNVLLIVVSLRQATLGAMRLSMMNVILVLMVWILPIFWEQLEEYGQHGTFFGITTGVCAGVGLIAALTLLRPGQLTTAHGSTA
jgi:hypothetical protein